MSIATLVAPFNLLILAAAVLSLCGAVSLPSGAARAESADQTQAIGAPRAMVRPARLPLDYRAAMRRFIIAFAETARRQNPKFQIVVAGGLELVAKRPDAMSVPKAPARHYLRTIDGILIDESPLTGQSTHGESETDESPVLWGLSERQHYLAGLARRHGVSVFVRRHGRSRHRPNVKPFITGPAVDTAAPDAFRRALTTRPANESAANITTLAEAKNFLPLFEVRAPHRTIRDFAYAVHNSNVDVLMLDAFFGRDPLPGEAVAILKHKRLGARRRVLVTVNIGMASGDRYYWRDTWGPGYPPYLAVPAGNEIERFHVAYWHPAWQKLIAGEKDSYLSGVLAQGFDGAVLLGAGAYSVFEGQPKLPGAGVRVRPAAPSPIPHPTPAEQDL